jgi:hypothetical protein
MIGELKGGRIGRGRGMIWGTMIAFALTDERKPPQILDSNQDFPNTRRGGIYSISALGRIAEFIWHVHHISVLFGKGHSKSGT